MEFLPKHPILEFPPETLSDVRKLHNLDKPGQLEEAVNILDEWIKKQNHFKKKTFDRHYLETTIITCKGSVERAKTRIDKYCTARTMMPSFFGVIDVTKDLKPLKSSIVILPKFAPGYKRVYIIKVAYNAQMDPDILIDFCRYNIVLSDYLRAHDYLDGVIGILDYTNFKIGEFLKAANPVEMRNLSVLHAEAFGNRVSGIHILTESKLIDTLVTLYKQVMSEKLGKRILVHKSMETIYDFVPRYILPEDYGGDERSVNVLYDDWFNILASKKAIEFLKTMNEAGTDEKLRPSDMFNTQYMGMPGTFRNLRVD